MGNELIDNSKVSFNNKMMNKYYITNKIGQGGYGECYLVESKKYAVKDEKLVAKVVNISKMSDLEKNKAVQEITILEMVDNINVIKLIEFYKTENLLCIIMELGEYGSLDDEITYRKNCEELAKKHFKEDEIMYIFIQIIFGVRYLHDNKIIHSDIKSNNIILFSDGTVKLTDFGISSILSNSYSNNSDKNIYGTFYYLAPEVFENMRNDNYSDYWSMGCLLLEMCSLEKVFRKYKIEELIVLSVKNSKVFIDEIDNHIKINKLNDIYSNELIGIAKGLLNPDPKKRLTIEKLLNNGYVKRYLKKFAETCINRNWNQFKDIVQYCDANLKNAVYKDNNFKLLELGSVPLWLKKDVFLENENNKFAIKQDLGEWFKNEEKKIRNTIKKKAAFNHFDTNNSFDRKLEEEKKISSDSNNDSYREIVEYLSLRKDNNKMKEMTREEILVQLEATIDFFAAQLSSLNSRKITTENIIRRNLENYIRKNTNVKVIPGNSNFRKQRSINNNLQTKNSTSLSFKTDFKSRYDKEREQLRELMRRGRQKIRMEKNCHNGVDN